MSILVETKLEKNLKNVGIRTRNLGATSDLQRNSMSALLGSSPATFFLFFYHK